MKLHGSLNWVLCDHCARVIPWQVSEFVRNRFWSDSKHVQVPIAACLDQFQHCGKTASQNPEPFLIPPTWNKTQYHDQLVSVWRSAGRELENAENIFICGYSLPQTDQFFHYLYALGSVGGAGLKRVWVFDPDEEVKERFAHILGEMALDRFEYHKVTFAEAVPIIQRALSG